MVVFTLNIAYNKIEIGGVKDGHIEKRRNLYSR